MRPSSERATRASALIDGRLFNVVLVLMLTTSIAGPVLTERFTPRLFTGPKPAQEA
jgi:hypothetical protein